MTEAASPNGPHLVIIEEEKMQSPRLVSMSLGPPGEHLNQHLRHRAIASPKPPGSDLEAAHPEAADPGAASPKLVPIALSSPNPPEAVKSASSVKSVDKTPSSRMGLPRFVSNKLPVAHLHVEKSKPESSESNSSCCYEGFAKHFFLGINMILLAAGMSLLVLGALGLANQIGLFSIQIPIICIAVGAVTVLIAIIAICASIFDNREFLSVYGWVLFAIIVGELILAFYIIAEVVNGKWDSILRKVWIDGSNDFKLDLQSRFQCCGFDGPDDFPGDPCDPEYFTTACSGEIGNWTSQFLYYIVAGALVVEVMQFTLLGFAVHLWFKDIKKAA